MYTQNLLKDISFLYELSLSIGQSLDKKENCKEFLHSLMSFKNIEFGAVWVQNRAIPSNKNQEGLGLIYSHPIVKLQKTTISNPNFIEEYFGGKNTSFSCILTEKISEEIGLKAEKGGVITFFLLEDIGLLALYSSFKKQIWTNIDQTKLKNVMSKFSVSLKACISHETSVEDLITIKETKNQLEKAKKVAGESELLKSAFLSNISHEIRTPINAIVGFSNLLSDSDISITERKNFINNISNNSQKLLKLINNLIDLSKMETNQLSIQKDTFVINPIITDIFKIHKANANKADLDFRLTLPDNSDTFKIYSDKNKIIQILNNLIDNAIKFTSKGTIEIGYFIENQTTAIFYIKDTGVGISPEKEDSVFDLFIQGESSSTRKFEGSGIGLTLCKKIVELLDGEIWFDTKENIGSNFYFKVHNTGQSNLKLLRDTSNRNEYKIRIDGSGIESIDYCGRTILIAEDVKSNFNYLNAIIELTHANVIWARNGKDAIDICKKNDPKIDLVLMDMKMPVVGGLDAIIQIKSYNKTLPVIVQTAFTLNNEKEECFNVGADEFITKPIDPHKLIEILQKFL
ncbi:response regulator [Labilibaculum sp.]|uniref:hybrid sensor histidine kinase/response regulator n=1 Tax=Labilibaculum sp. TaxID=2060723 RepID=UPI00356B153E